MKKIAVLTPIHEAGYAVVEGRRDVTVEVNEDPSPEGIARAVRGAHGVLVRNARITRDVVEAAREVRIMSRHGVGYDNIDVPALTARGIPLAITVHANAVSVAEHAMYLILALAKRGPFHDRMTRAGQFRVRYEMHASEVAEKRLLVVGFGRTGSRLARRAAAFDMSVHAYDPYVSRATIEAAGCVAEPSFEAALGEADFVSFHCPLSEETRAMLGRRALGLMKPGARVINTARGGVVDEAALLEALGSGHLAGAGLDVFEVEPPGQDHPLFALDNVIVSPHAAGVSLEASLRVSTHAMQYILDAFDGRLDPGVVVNPEVLPGPSR